MKGWAAFATDPLEQGMEADVVAALAGKPLPNKRAFVYGGPGK
jgi:hypothetical protein